MIPDDPELCTVTQAAHLLGFTRHAVQVALREGRLAGFRTTQHRWLVYVPDLKHYHERSAQAKRENARRSARLVKQRREEARDHAHENSYPYCLRCGLELDQHHQCPDCQREAAGQPYYILRESPFLQAALTCTLYQP